MSHSIVACRIAPDVPTRRGKTARRYDPPRVEWWRLLRENVKEREFVRDILNLNVVGNDVTLQACAKCFAKLWLGIDQKSFAECAYENLRVQFAFRTEHAGFHRDSFTRLTQIVGDLPVQKSQSVSPGHAKLCARGEILKED